MSPLKAITGEAAKLPEQQQREVLAMIKGLVSLNESNRAEEQGA